MKAAVLVWTVVSHIDYTCKNSHVSSPRMSRPVWSVSAQRGRGHVFGQKLGKQRVCVGCGRVRRPRGCRSRQSSRVARDRERQALDPTLDVVVYEDVIIDQKLVVPERDAVVDTNRARELLHDRLTLRGEHIAEEKSHTLSFYLTHLKRHFLSGSMALTSLTSFSSSFRRSLAALEKSSSTVIPEFFRILALRKISSLSDHFCMMK